MNYQRVVEQINAGDYRSAMESLSSHLDNNPSDPMALYLIGRIFLKTEKRGLAYNIFSICAEAAPDRPEVWVNYGASHPDTKEGLEGARHCFETALSISPDYGPALSHLSTLAIQTCEPEKVLSLADKALTQNPDDALALSNKAFGYLFQQEWEKAWEHYDHLLRTSARPEVTYGDLPRWDGTKGKTVIVSGEQGIGDEILYSSVLEDMSRDCTVIYDCFPRLERLFERSFGDRVHIMGARWDNEIALPDGLKADAYIPLAGICRYYRNSESDFPGDPYLKADPGLRKAMRGLLDSFGDRPKIGVAWTGGSDRTRGYLRTKTLEELTPILRQDAVFVSLQYTDSTKEISEYKSRRGITVHHFPQITEAKDYDYTAALVAELDLVISVPTSVTQLSGALGTECWVMVPEMTGWLFYSENYPWARTVKPYRNRPVTFFEENLKEWLSRKKGNEAIEIVSKEIKKTA